MGKVVHLDEVRAFMGQTPAFRARDIELIVKNRAYALLLMHNLVKRGEVHRITRGWYSRLDDPVVTVFAFKPAYLGLQEALSLQGLWEQETNVILITPRAVRRGERSIMGSKVFVRKVDKKRFFGFEYLSQDGFAVPVSDVEKTLIDLVYFGETPDDEVLAEIRRRADIRRLSRYLEAYPGDFGRRVRSLLRPT
ncbi:MAG: hypothetical protein KGI38_10970 [Thaumarchaeota archaeon]|nr:hypothetical protein [Nitrososphaerota archaeon]